MIAPLAMGKKGKRAGKAGTAVAKQGPGKARRERAVAFKDFELRLDALTETLEADLQGKDMFPPLDEQKRKECPLCLKNLPLTRISSPATVMFPCCGQLICMACRNIWDETANTKFAPCPLCRSDPPADPLDEIKFLQKRAESSDAMVMYELSKHYLSYCDGSYLKPDSIKSFELKLRAAELRYPQSVYFLGHFNLRRPHYSDEDDLDGLKRDMRLGIRLIECAARMGNVFAHHELGLLYKNGEHTKHQDHDLSVKHFSYAARCGFENSLQVLRGHARRERLSVDEFIEIEKAYKEANGEDDEESTTSDDDKLTT